MPSSPETREESASLYAIGIQLQTLSSEIAAAANLLQEDDPDLQQEGVDLLEQYLAIQDGTRAALSTKADRLLGFCDHLIAQAAFRKGQADRLKKLAERDQALVDRLHTYLIKVLTTLEPDTTKFVFDTHELTSRKSESVLIDDDLDPARDLEPQFLRTKTITEPDKTAIKAALKAGTAVPGCTLQSQRNWTVQ